MSNIFKKLAKHTVIYGIGDVLRRALGLFLIPIYTHYLTTDQYGTIELLELSTYVFSALIALGLDQAVVRIFFEQKDDTDRKTVLSTALISLSVLSGIGLMILFPNTGRISTLIFQTPNHADFFKMIFCTMSLQIISLVPLHYLRIQERSAVYSVMSLTQFVISVALNITLVVYYRMHIWGVLISGFAVSVLSLIFLTVYVMRDVPMIFSRQKLRQMLVFGLPLVWSWLGMFCLHFSDRFLLERYSSLQEVGVYALAYKFGMVMNFLLLTPFLNIWTPQQYQIVKQKDAPEIFARVILYYALIQIFLSLGIAALVGDVLGLVSGAEFQRAAGYVPLILIGYNFYGLFQLMQFGLLYKKATKRLAVLMSAAVGINICLNILLIPHFGAFATAANTGVAFGILFFLTAHAAQKKYLIPVEWRKIIVAAAIAIMTWAMAVGFDAHNPYVGILLRTMIVLIFPSIMLWRFGFFSEEERRHLGEILARVKLRRSRPTNPPPVSQQLPPAE